MRKRRYIVKVTLYFDAAPIRTRVEAHKFKALAILSWLLQSIPVGRFHTKATYPSERMEVA